MFLQLLHLPQAALSAYGIYLSGIAITDLMEYEQTTQKAAEYSKHVEHELYKTRTTQASGAVAMTLSFTAALILSTIGYLFHPNNWFKYGFSPFMLVVVLGARGHIANYWAPSNGKTVGVRVPLPKMDKYNAAQKKTEQILEVLQYLEWSWVATSLVVGVVGY